MLIEPQEMAVSQNQLVKALTEIRQEWELAAEGESLLNVRGNVGLLLADFVVALGLPPVETVQVLGAELAGELQGVLFPA